MGVESYGLIGVFTSLVGTLAVLDLGLSQAMNREMARLSGEPNNAHRMADTARTLEVIYWAIALIVVAAIVLMSDFIAYRWLNPEQLSSEVLRRSLWIMALVIGLRWPVAIYTGGLNGLQRQVIVNILLAIFATFQGAGALAVLWFIEPTIQAFFLWQAFIALMQVITLRVALRLTISATCKGKFRKQVLHDIWRFAAGMTGITLMAAVLTQLDKLMLSKMLTLTEFGYYTFATAIAGVVFRIIGPVFTAYFPRLSFTVAKGDHLDLVRTFHQGCQLMAVATLPITLVLAFFSKEILVLWTHNPDVVAHSSLLISLLVIGNALNGLMHIPYALQLAHDWTKFAFYQNVIAVIVLAPAIYYATLYWGAVGASSVWVLLNTCYVLIGIQFMYRRLLINEKLSWYVNDVGKILLSVLVVTCAVRVFIVNGYELSDLAKVAIFLATLGVATLMAILSVDTLRNQFSRINY